MRTVLTAALGYAALVFVAGFLLGTLRVLRVAPRIGALAAVASEVPVMVALSWLAARAVLARRPLPRRTARLAMGALSFALLMLAEAALALALGQRLSEWARTMTTAPGALGLAGQVAFALIPSFLPKYPRGVNAALAAEGAEGPLTPAAGPARPAGRRSWPPRAPPRR